LKQQKGEVREGEKKTEMANSLSLTAFVWISHLQRLYDSPLGRQTCHSGVFVERVQK